MIYIQVTTMLLRTLPLFNQQKTTPYPLGNTISSTNWMIHPLIVNELQALWVVTSPKAEIKILQTTNTKCL